MNVAPEWRVALAGALQRWIEVVRDDAAALGALAPHLIEESYAARRIERFGRDELISRIRTMRGVLVQCERALARGELSLEQRAVLAERIRAVKGE